MNILSTGIERILPSSQVAEQFKPAETEGTGFGEFLKGAIDEVNSLQQESADMKTKLVTGDLQDLHQVMIAAEKANLAFQLTLQIRNKVVEAYQEVMRMQV